MGSGCQIKEGVLASTRLRQWDGGWSFFCWVFDCYSWARWDCEEVDFRKIKCGLVIYYEHYARS